MKWHDKFIIKNKFKQGDWALLFDSKFKKFKGNLTTCWLGPYEIEIVFENGSVKINTIGEKEFSFLVNGHKLRLYQKNLTKEELVHNLLQQSEMEVVSTGCLSPST